jgi:hypothetical protein
MKWVVAGAVVASFLGGVILGAVSTAWALASKNSVHELEGQDQ